VAVYLYSLVLSILCHPQKILDYNNTKQDNLQWQNFTWEAPKETNGTVDFE